MYSFRASSTSPECIQLQDRFIDRSLHWVGFRKDMLPSFEAEIGASLDVGLHSKTHYTCCVVFLF